MEEKATMEKITFMSRIKRFQCFMPNGRAVKFIGGRFETDDPKAIEFLREQIKGDKLHYQGKQVVFEKVPPPPPVKCQGCGKMLSAAPDVLFCPACGTRKPESMFPTMKPINPLIEKPAAPPMPESNADEVGDKAKRGRKPLTEGGIIK